MQDKAPCLGQLHQIAPLPVRRTMVRDELLAGDPLVPSGANGDEFEFPELRRAVGPLIEIGIPIGCRDFPGGEK
jgi:hypothetical protein